jgi:hypothetical protein
MLNGESQLEPSENLVGKALPNLPSRDSTRGQIVPVTPHPSDVTVSDATPFRQKVRKYMSKRSGQTGQVLLRSGRWVGRFYVDVPGESKRTRRAAILGMKKEFTKPEANRKLSVRHHHR